MGQYVESCGREFSVKEGLELRENLVQDICELNKLPGVLTDKRIPKSC